jgi:DnaK suppressor protein
MNDYAGVEKRLVALLDDLRRRTSKIEGDLRRTPNRDSEERAQESENDEVLERLDRGGLDEISAIEAALGRIRSGDYGRCTSCGEAIAVGRLDALPFARTCIDCAE